MSEGNGAEGNRAAATVGGTAQHPDLYARPVLDTAAQKDTR